MLTIVRWFDASAEAVAILERPLLHGDDPKASAMFGLSVAEVARVGDVWVPQAPLLLPDPGFSVTSNGRHVRVPTFPYRTTRAAAALVATGIELGLAALEKLRQHTSDQVVAATLVVGHECVDLASEGAYRYHAGIALWTRIDPALLSKGTP